MLQNLRRDYQLTSLEKSKQSKPWELITNPTVSENPIAPRKKLIVFYWTLMGTFIAILSSYLFEKKSDLVYEINEYEKILGSPILCNINFEEDPSSIEKVESIVDIANDQIINILKFGTINEKTISLISNHLKNKFPEIKLNYYSNIYDLSQKNITVLINSKNTQFKDLKELNKIIDYKNIDIKNLILCT